jgi:hypothetical protein
LFYPIYVLDKVRPRGWYVQDVARSHKNALVIVGDRHPSERSAQREADRLSALASAE